MAFINGKNVVIEFETTTPGTYAALYCCKDAAIELAADLLKSTDTNDGKFAAFIGQSISGTIRTSALARIDTDGSPYGLPETFDLFINLTKVRVRMTLTDNASNTKYFQAYGYIQNLGLNASVFGLAEQAVSIQLSGAITLT